MKTNIKRTSLVSLFLAFLIALVGFAFSQTSIALVNAEETLGSKENPYTISTLAELESFRDDVNNGNTYAGKYIKLTADIDLDSIEDWKPIGNSTNIFQGYFDGNGKTISNLTVLGSNDYVGFFGNIKGSGMTATATPTVKDLFLSNVSISGNYRVGGLSGQGYICNVTNVSVSGEVNGVRYVGGLVGHVYTYFKDCNFNGYASCSFDALGGIAGAGDCRAYDCSVIGTVSGSNWVGGIIGNGQEGTSAVGCYVKATVSTDTNYYFGIGGIAGVGGHGYSSSEFKNNYFDGEVYLEGQKVNAIVTGIINADNDSIGTTVSGNSWNTEYYDVETPVLVVGDVTQNATPEEWSQGANETLTTTRNNNLVVLESDIQYVDAKDISDVTIVDVSKFDSNLTTIQPDQLTEKIVDNSKVAEINGIKYKSFDDALNAAKDLTGEVTVEIYDKVTLKNNLTGSYDKIKFVGMTDVAEIYLDVQGYITATNKKVAFENLILSKSSGGFITNAGFMNVAFGVYDVLEVNYTNCFFANGAYASSGDVTFNGCTFKRSYDKYGLWAYGNVDTTVNECVFDDYRGIKMYAEGGAKTVALKVTNTDFSKANDKPAIVLTYGASIELDENIYSSKGALELDKDGAPNGTTVVADKEEIAKLVCVNDDGACGVLVDGKIYTSVQDAVAVAKVGDTVTLLHNSTEIVEFPADVIIDYNGFTAENVKNEPLEIEDITVERNAEDNATIVTITYLNSQKVTTIVIPDGKDGVNGSNGLDGKDGVDGTNGIDGVNGLDGKDGLNGVNGKDANSSSATVSIILSSVSLVSVIALGVIAFIKKR